jgi:hypothetical protein
MASARVVVEIGVMGFEQHHTCGHTSERRSAPA